MMFEPLLLWDAILITTFYIAVLLEKNQKSNQ